LNEFIVMVTNAFPWTRYIILMLQLYIHLLLTIHLHVWEITIIFLIIELLLLHIC